MSMKINLAKNAGFCFGVKRAIDISLKTAALNKKSFMLGDIVHNENVVNKIKTAGINKIKKLSGSGKNKILLIRAHGTSKKILKRARSLGYQIIDATCPMVHEIHRIAQRAQADGYTIIVIGDKKHDEVRGIVGQLHKKAIVIESPNSIPARNIKKACIVVQSTQNIDEVNKIVSALKTHIGELKFFNTICRPTRMKQEEIKLMPVKNDVMIIIGSKNSANTRRLYEICKSLNRRTFWIQSRDDIKSTWFNGAKNVGVTAGASTPDETTYEIISCLKKI